MRYFTFAKYPDETVRRDRNISLVLALLWVVVVAFHLATNSDNIWAVFFAVLAALAFGVNFVGAQYELTKRNWAFNERNAQMRREREEAERFRMLEDPGHPDADRTT